MRTVSKISFSTVVCFWNINSRWPASSSWAPLARPVVSHNHNHCRITGSRWSQCERRNVLSGEMRHGKRDSDTVTFVVSTSEIHSRKEERVKLRKEEVRASREEEDTTTFALSWHMTRGSRAKKLKEEEKSPPLPAGLNEVHGFFRLLCALGRWWIV